MGSWIKIFSNYIIKSKPSLNLKIGVSYQYITKNSWHGKLKYRKKAHKVYSLHYHLVFVVKYRQDVFVEEYEIINFIKSMFEEISEEYGVEIEEVYPLRC